MRGRVDHFVFGPDGAWLRTIGQEGQGPGEFESLWGMTVAADRLVVDDRGNQRFSVWSLDGEHVADHQKRSPGTLYNMEGLTDESLVARSTDRSPDGGQLLTIVRMSIDGTEISRLVEAEGGPLIVPESGWGVMDMVGAFFDLIAQPAIGMAVGARSTVYVTPLHEYQVLALAPDGEPRWALRVAWPKPPYPHSAKQDVILRSGALEAGVGIDAVDWPEEYRAVESLRTDGAGRLYVFPEFRFDGEEPPERRPVDVYSPGGDLLAAGLVPTLWNDEIGRFSSNWSYAVGEYVYGLRANDRDESDVVRYRIELH